jgi:hypothetical protein
LWQQRLSHANLAWIQSLMRNRKWIENPAMASSLHTGPFISTSSQAPTCDVQGLKCLACLCMKATIPTTKIIATTLLPVKTNVLKQEHLLPGSCVSVDHYMSSVMGRLSHTFGCEWIGYSCGTLLVDHASGKICNFCQYSTNADETITNKHRLESYARQDGVIIKGYNADNGVFASKAFKKDCDLLHQLYTFSGVGAHHQSGVAEWNIKTITQWAWANMLRFAHHWPAKAKVCFWLQAIKYSIWVFNRMPNLANDLSPNELWSSSRAQTEEFHRTHVFGCSVYVLDAALQDGRK